MLIRETQKNAGTSQRSPQAAHEPDFHGYSGDVIRNDRGQEQDDL